MNQAIVSSIPFLSEILKGDWYEIVYAIITESDSQLENDYTVSLREVKRELVAADDRLQRYCTLVQFRIKDIY